MLQNEETHTFSPYAFTSPALSDFAADFQVKAHLKLCWCGFVMLSSFVMKMSSFSSCLIFSLRRFRFFKDARRLCYTCLALILSPPPTFKPVLTELMYPIAREFQGTILYPTSKWDSFVDNTSQIVLFGGIFFVTEEMERR